MSTGFFVAGCVAMFIIFYELAVTARAEAKTLGPDVHRCFMSCGVLTLFIWLLYPIAWGVCEGGNVITPDSEAAFYGVLDVIAKPVSPRTLYFNNLLGPCGTAADILRFAGLQCCIDLRSLERISLTTWTCDPIRKACRQWCTRRVGKRPSGTRPDDQRGRLGDAASV